MKIINAGNINATMQIVMQYAKKGSQTAWAKANHGSHFELWRKLRQTIKYTPDPEGKELIRSVEETLKGKKADCEDFAIMISAIMLHKKIGHSFRIYDYGRGWEHIALVLADGTIIDPVNDVFNVEPEYVKVKDYTIKKEPIGLGRINNKTMKAKQLKIQFKNGLGKLPTSLISDRERFTLTLWAYFVQNGATYSLEQKYGEFTEEYSKGYQNTLPKNITDLNQLVKILRSNLFGVDAELIAGKEILAKDYGQSIRKKIQKPDTIKVSLGKQTFSFDPYYLADSVFRAYGVEGLAPKKKASTTTDQDISPNNQKLMDLMKPFVTTDKTKDRLLGVNFSEDGVCATDGYVLAWLQAKTNYNKTYDFKGAIIDERYPNFVGIIPKDNIDAVTVQTAEIKKALKQAVPYTNKITSAIALAINPNNDGGDIYIYASDLDINQEIELSVNSQNDCPPKIIGVNAKYFLKIVTTIEKLKVKEFTFYSSTPSTALTITVNTEYGKLLFLLMPVFISTNSNYEEKIKKFYERVEMLNRNKGQAPDPNKAFIMARAKAKLKLLALNF